MRPPWFTTRRATSPSPAYVVMLRAISEIAVASSVRSVLENPSPVPIVRASWRAVTTSASVRIATRTSSTAVLLSVELPLQERQSLLEVQRGVHVLEVHPELDHREGDLRLDPDDHRLRPAQPRHVRDAAQRARHERVHHVERGDVDDDPARAEPADLDHHVVLEADHVGVGERRLDRRDQERALLENWYRHAGRALSGPRAATPSRPARPRSRAAARPPRCRPAGRRPR